MDQKTVTINGTIYDAHTGMPIKKNTPLHQINPAPKVPKPEEHHSHSIHQITQKSQTLNRRAVKKAIPSQPKSHAAISKFAPHPSGSPAKTVTRDIKPATHPLVHKANQQIQTKRAVSAPVSKTLAPKPAKIIKEEAIAEALKKAPSHSKNHKQVKQPKKFQRFISIASAGVALLLLGGYFTYINMPNLSVRVAAAQAGINATYPGYRPDGYSLNGPIAYSDGAVTINFASNSGSQNFAISQTKTSWDSTALEENYISKESGGSYVDPYIENGLKIYVYDNNAAWINGGVLYKLTGDAPLSTDQIRRIATSM